MNPSPFPEISQEVYSAALRLGSHPAAREAGCTVLESVHPYTTTEGAESWWIARWRNPRTREKVPLPLRREGTGFRCKRPDFGPEGAPLYRLHKLGQYPSDLVYLVEGEFCADCLEGMGFISTTWPGGALAVGRVDFRPLAGRWVVLWPDNDENGFRAMREAADRLRRLGARVVVLDVAALDLPPKGDVVDWLARFIESHGARELCAIPGGCAQAWEAVRALPVVQEWSVAA